MSFFTNILIKLIKAYKFLISPLFGHSCRYLPTCSEYFIDCLKFHGPIKGFLLGLKRVASCHPIKILGGSSGVDPAPRPKRRINNGIWIW